MGGSNGSRHDQYSRQRNKARGAWRDPVEAPHIIAAPPLAQRQIADLDFGNVALHDGLGARDFRDRLRTPHALGLSAATCAETRT